MGHLVAISARLKSMIPTTTEFLTRLITALSRLILINWTQMEMDWVTSVIPMMMGMVCWIPSKTPTITV